MRHVSPFSQVPPMPSQSSFFFCSKGSPPPTREPFWFSPASPKWQSFFSGLFFPLYFGFLLSRINPSFTFPSTTPSPFSNPCGFAFPSHHLFLLYTSPSVRIRLLFYLTIFSPGTLAFRLHKGWAKIGGHFHLHQAFAPFRPAAARPPQKKSCIPICSDPLPSCLLFPSSF